MAKVLGIGNALVDLLITLEDDNLLDELKLPKGSMQLVDAATKAMIAEKSQHLSNDKASGGSAANTIHGLAKLGVETAYIGSIGNDSTGEFFKQDLINSGITPFVNTSGTPTGIASTLISKDGERTFGTYLGAAIELSPDTLNPDFFDGYDILHVEGYLVQNHELLETIFRTAKEKGLKISLDMASYNVVEDNLGFLKKMVAEYIDIIFANEEEAKAFTSLEPEAALDAMAEVTETTIVKVGKEGSMVKRNGKINRADAYQAKVVDTTGAGDIYAAGFLFGMIQGMDMDKSARIGSLLASKVIEGLGAKIDDDQWPGILGMIPSL